MRYSPDYIRLPALLAASPGGRAQAYNHKLLGFGVFHLTFLS